MSINTPSYRAGSAESHTGSVDVDHTRNVAVLTRTGINPQLWARIWFVLAMGALAYFVQLNEVGRTAFAGSQSAYLVVAPVLAGLVAAGYSHAPRGVIDTESDWIGAVLLFAGGFTTIYLLESRLPTMAALWHLENIGIIIWVAACGMVVFSGRHVLRMWNVWLFGLVLAPVMPFMLMTAQLGGSDTAIALAAALLGTLAVYLGSRFVGMPRRLVATAANLALSCGAAFLLDSNSLNLRVSLVAGAIPLAVMVAQHRFAHVSSNYPIPNLPSNLPRTKPVSYVVLIVVAIAMLCWQLPMTRPASVDEVRADWAVSSQLEPVQSFNFITRFLGPEATLTRYRPHADTGQFGTAVDVISTPDLARLRDLSDAVWYPSTIPLNYQPVDTELDIPTSFQARAIHTNADATTTDAAQNWYAVTWIWRTAAVYQQVTVMVNQSSPDSPVLPRPLSIGDTMVKPLLWVARQQPESTGAIDPLVIKKADDIVREFVYTAESFDVFAEPNGG